MKILLINQSNGIDFNQNPPLGILYLAASLRKANYEVDIYDQGAKENKLNYPSIDYMKNFSPDVVGFSLYTFGLPQTLQYIKGLKEEFPHIKIIVGGHHATALPERTMLDCPEADVLVCGEGDVTIIELIKAIEKGSNLDQVQGIYYRNNGTIVHTGSRPYIENLDILPFPANDLIEKYTYPSEGIEVGKKILNLTASRGCPFSCAYCNKAVYGSVFRRRSPKNVVDEIKYMFERFGYDEVMFHDELFTAKRAWLYELFEEFKKRGLRFPWRCLGKVGTVDYELLSAMQESGCYIIAFGLESGNAKVREDISRKMTNEEIKNTFDLAKRAGIMTYAFNMINHRLDTVATIRDTYNLMCEVNPTFAPVFICSPLPGSPIYQYVPENIKYDWERFNSYRDFGAYPISISAVPEKDLVVLASQMESFYYSRPMYFFKNILASGIDFGIKKTLFKLWIGHLLTGRLKHLAKDDFFITGRSPCAAKKLLYRAAYACLKGITGIFRKNPFIGFVYKKLTQGYQ
ncbi:MAG: cobalamin B12-binding domain-containing protein [Deltaproteobacteria bacterium]|nr:cobalamin B12-binding domain-containing protein [Deltaproteobacteria bacterium]